MDALKMEVPAVVKALDAVGHTVNRQTVHGWRDDENIGKASLVALFQALSVPLDERRAWADACGYGDLIDAVAPVAAP